MNILDAFEKSSKIKRSGWASDNYISKEITIEPLCLVSVLATDWEPVIEPLTFERIKRECVPKKTIFVDIDGSKEIYLGFSCRGLLITETSDHEDIAILWYEDEIKNWQISSEKWEG